VLLSVELERYALGVDLSDNSSAEAIDGAIRQVLALPPERWSNRVPAGLVLSELAMVKKQSQSAATRAYDNAVGRLVVWRSTMAFLGEDAQMLSAVFSLYPEMSYRLGKRRFSIMGRNLADFHVVFPGGDEHVFEVGYVAAQRLIAVIEEGQSSWRRNPTFAKDLDDRVRLMFATPPGEGVDEFWRLRRNATGAG
jgi:hypothetical protein